MAKMREAKKISVKEEIQETDEEYQKVLDEKRALTEEYSAMIAEEKAELEEFKKKRQEKKDLDVLRKAGKLVTMARFQFHYQEQPGGILGFTKEGIRYVLRDLEEYVYLKEIADHINSLKYPDRSLVRKTGEKKAKMKVVGWIPRCTATVLETFEKVFDKETDIPNQDEWKDKAIAAF